jgi:putative Mn2+ efflux pump MntP
LGAGLLIATGLYTVLHARRDTSGVDRPTSLGVLVLTGAALSIDNLVVGFALGARNVALFAAAIAIAVFSVGMSLVGLEVGRRLGRSVEEWSGELGGAVLILVGIFIAAKVL